MPEKMDMNELGEKIKLLFEQGLSDEEMAEKIGVNWKHVEMIRSLMGLKRRWAIDIFKESKALSFNEYTNCFRIDFSISPENQKFLGISAENQYMYMCSVSKEKEIVIHLMRK